MCAVYCAGTTYNAFRHTFAAASPTRTLASLSNHHLLCTSQSIGVDSRKEFPPEAKISPTPAGEPAQTYAIKLVFREDTIYYFRYK